MRWAAPLLTLLLMACSGPPPRPAVTGPEAAGTAPGVSIGGSLRGLYGYSR